MLTELKWIHLMAMGLFHSEYYMPRFTPKRPVSPSYIKSIELACTPSVILDGWGAPPMLYVSYPRTRYSVHFSKTGSTIPKQEYYIIRTM